jgi:osmotically-inducible protein OsmY
MPNNAIRQQIEGLLTHDTRVNFPACQLQISVFDAVATLTGTVPTVAAKRLAVSLAAQVPGVKGVEDRMMVASPMPMGDLEILEHIRRAFLQERNIETENIDVFVNPLGQVTLEGHVHSLAQKRMCEVLCWWVPGVTAVDNLIDVIPAERDSDDELKDNLITIMEKDVLVDPKKFRIDVRQSRITLSGHVDSETERDAAERDCWYTPGVLDVTNNLRT